MSHFSRKKCTAFFDFSSYKPLRSSFEIQFSIENIRHCFILGLPWNHGRCCLNPYSFEKKTGPSLVSRNHIIPLARKNIRYFCFIASDFVLRKSDWSLKSGQLVYIGNIPKWRLGRLSSFWINISRKFLVQHFNQCPNCGKSPHSARVQAEQRRLMHLEKGECPGFENSDGQSTEKLVA